MTQKDPKTMKKLLCIFGFHNKEYMSESSEDGGTIGWWKCKRCGHETEKSCSHTFGPISFELNSKPHD